VHTPPHIKFFCTYNLFNRWHTYQVISNSSHPPFHTSL
jgi:hypothetical protein